MKKLIYCAAVLVTALFAGSCQRELLDPAQDGSTVTFTVNVPEVATKSIGDAQNVNNLVYAVYRVTGETEADAKKGLTPEKLVYQDHNSVVEGKSTVTLELINDQAYVVVFWAQVGNTWFTNDYQFGTETVTYPSDLVANNDKYSAFYGVSYIADVKAPATKNITLHRPFAQINIATKDPEKYNVAINNTYVSVANAASAFDVAKEEAVVTENYSVSFKAAPMPANETLTVNGVEYQTRVQNTGSKENDVHHYIAMNYVFADGNVDVTYVIDTDHGVVTNTISNVPVAKNYRTNIVGNLLTSDVKYNVELDQKWAGPDYNGIYVFDAKQLQEAINSITSTSSPVIYFADDIEGDVTVVQKPGVKITIDGNDYKYDGSIKVHGNSNHYADAALTIKNVKFETSSTYPGLDGNPCFNFIEALEFSNDKRYSANITVEDCTFTATGDAVNTAVGLQIKSSKWAKVLNCTATNMHSLIQAQSCDETVEVKNCKITGKNGVAFKQVKAATVEGCTIKANGDAADGSVGYGIRFDGNCENYGITVKDNTINAVQPFIVRKMTGKNNTITLEGENTLKTDANYQIIITNGSDDKPYEKPTGTYNLDGEEKFYIYEGQSVAKVGTTEYSTIDDAIANWTNNSTLTLLANVRLRNVIEISSTEYHILDLGTYTMTAASKKDAIQIVNNGRSSASYALDIKADATNPGGITATGKAVVKTTGKSGVKDRPIIRFYNGVFTGTNVVYHSGSNGTNCPQFWFYGGVYNGTVYANRALFQFYGGTFNGNLQISVDSSAYALITGGTFKELNNLYNSALNTDKFTIGSKKGVFDCGVYVDDNGYFVVGGPVITKYGSRFEAKTTNISKAGKYLPYSSAAEYGLYYTKADVAIDKIGEDNVVQFVAKIGDIKYATLQDALNNVDEDKTVTVCGEITDNVKLPATLKNVTIKGGDKCLLKDMTISAADGNSVDYEGLTFDGITFENSNVVLTGWRTSGVVYKDITVTNCRFRNVIRTNNEAAFHINCDATEAVNGFIFTNNVIDGVSGASNSGLYAQLTGEVLISGNVINNVAFRPYVIQITNDDGVEDEFVVTRNTFSGSSKGRAQGLGNNAAGTDQVNLVVSENIFKGITDAQQICYWDFNVEKTTADLSKNYYDIDIAENPSKIYYNAAANSVEDLITMGVYPIYTELNADGTINTYSLVEAPTQE